MIIYHNLIHQYLANYIFFIRLESLLEYNLNNNNNYKC